MRPKDWVRRTGPSGRSNWMRHPAKPSAGGGRTAIHAGRRQLRETTGLASRLPPSGVRRQAYHAQQKTLNRSPSSTTFVAQCTPGMVLFDVCAHFGLFGSGGGALRRPDRPRWWPWTPRRRRGA